MKKLLFIVLFVSAPVFANDECSHNAKCVKIIKAYEAAHHYVHPKYK